jgi:hypothetical protein
VAKISAVVWTMDNDNQLRSWEERVALPVLDHRGGSRDRRLTPGTGLEVGLSGGPPW